MKTWEILLFVACWLAVDLTVATIVAVALSAWTPWAVFFGWVVWLGQPSRRFERATWRRAQANHAWSWR